MSVECSGTAELDAVLDSLKMSVRDGVCNSAEIIERALRSYDCPVTTGWSTRRGWIRVEEKRA